MPEGFRYAPDVISAAEEARLVAAAGELATDDNLQRDGSNKWVSADSVKGLFSPQEEAKAAHPRV